MNSKFDGNKLFEIRRSKKISQAKLASKINVSRQTIYLWESNQSIPDIEKVTRLCEALEIDIKELIDIAEVEDNVEISNKPRTKTNILSKLVKVIIISLLFSYIIFSTMKFITLNKILNKWDELDKIDNYYIEIQEYLVNENDRIITSENLFYEKYYHNGILKTIIKDRKNNNILNIVICNYNIGKKYIIYEENKTYRIEKISKNENSFKLSSNFSSLLKLRKNNSRFINYINCFNYNFKVIKKEDYEIIFKNELKEVILEDTFLVDSEETLNDNFRKYKRHYITELNSTKDFEIDLSDYTEIE